MVCSPNVASIRAARPGDIAALVSMAAEGFPDSPRWRQGGAFARRWWDVALASPFAESWIVDIEDAPVAFAVLVVDEEGWGVERTARCGRPHDYLRTMASQLDMLIPELKRRQRLRSAARLPGRADTRVIAGERIWIELISVSREARGTGMAQKLMQWCEIRTVAWGRNRIEYNVEPDNSRMRALGERTGYILRAYTRAGCLYSKQNLSPDSNPVQQVTPPRLSVTIVNHSAGDLLRACLRSLHDHPYTLGATEIIVLDNASDDGSVEMARAAFDDIVFITETERRGFGSNQNRAIAKATGGLIFMLNPDAVVHAGTLDRLVLAVADDPRIAAAGGCVFNDDGSVRQESLHRFETPLTPFASAVGADRRHKHHPVGDTDTVTADGWPSGGACLVRRAVFDTLEGFDEDFFMYAEDMDLFARIVDAGHLVAWVPKAVVTHPFPDETGAASSQRESEKVRSATLYIRKHFGCFGAAIHRVGMAIDASVRVLVLVVPGLSRIMKHHGRSTASLRRRYLARLHHIVRPGGGSGLFELAADWNAENRDTRPPATDS